MAPGRGSSGERVPGARWWCASRLGSVDPAKRRVSPNAVRAAELPQTSVRLRQKSLLDQWSDPRADTVTPPGGPRSVTTAGRHFPPLPPPPGDNWPRQNRRCRPEQPFRDVLWRCPRRRRQPSARREQPAYPFSRVQRRQRSMALNASPAKARPCEHPMPRERQRLPRPTRS